MLEDDFRGQWKRFSFSEPSTLLLSGGGDSVALFHLLRAVGADFQCLHFVHDSPGGFARRSEAFCRDLCQKYQTSLEVLPIAGHSLAERGDLSWEAACRQLRYSEVSHRSGLFLTAHTLDDQAETVVMRLLDGSGLGGLAGVRERRGNVLRPLLPFSRERLRRYLQGGGFEFLDDPTNLEGNDRARIRSQILPVLEQFCPQLKATVARTASRLADDEDYLQSQLQRWLTDNTLPGGDHWNLEAVQGLPGPLGWRFLKFLWKNLGESGYRPRGTLFEEALRLIEQGTNEGLVAFPGGWAVQILGSKLWVRPALPEWDWDFQKIATLGKRPFLEVLDPSLLTLPGQRVRCRRPGDRVRGRSLKKELAQKTAQPSWVRDYWPVLETEGEITGIWGIYSKGDDRWMQGLKFYPERLRAPVFASTVEKVVK